MANTKTIEKRRSPVQGSSSVIKALRALHFISELGYGATVQDIQERMKLPRPTIYRLLNTLEQESFVERNPISGKYVLGRKAIKLGQRAVSYSNLSERVRSTLQAIGEATGETVHLGIPYGCHMTFIDKVESSESVRMASYIGMPVPMYSTSVGKAYLAALDETVLEQYLEKLTMEVITPRTIVSFDELRDELARTKDRGYSIDDEENEMGIICFGHAIYAVDGTPAGAISVSVPRYRLPEHGESTIASTIRRYCQQAGLLV